MMTLRMTLAIAGLAVLGFFALAAFFLQENLTLFFLNPKTPYETYSPPPPPDYAEAEAWAWLPSERAEEDISETERRPAIFYIHSTTYRSRENWNGPITEDGSRTATLRTALPNEAGPFATLGDIYAPFYRQATLFAFFTQKHQGRESRRTAYGDVARAFDEFLNRIGPVRPIMIVGYGQGGLHAQRLLIDHFQRDEQLRRRLVAAYIIDHAMPDDLFEYALANLSSCTTPDETRCVVSYSAYTPRFDKEMWRTRNRQLIWEPDGTLRASANRPLVCTNPLTWRGDETVADEENHLGAASATGMPFGEPPVLVEKAVGVRCENGIAVTDKPSKGWLQRPRWFGRQWAPLNYNLFYEDLRQNARTRITALAVQRDDEGIPAPPMNDVEDLDAAPVNQVPDL